MLKRLLPILLVAITTISCNFDPVRSGAEKTLKATEKTEGYEFIELKDKASYSVQKCLKLEEEFIMRHIANGTQYFCHVNYGNYDDEKIEAYYQSVHEKFKTQEERLTEKYGKIVVLKYKFRENKELIDSYRYFIVNNEDKIISGPYVKYNDAENEYKYFTLEHLPGFQRWQGETHKKIEQKKGAGQFDQPPFFC